MKKIFIVAESWTQVDTEEVHKAKETPSSSSSTRDHGYGGTYESKTNIYSTMHACSNLTLCVFVCVCVCVYALAGDKDPAGSALLPECGWDEEDTQEETGG